MGFLKALRAVGPRVVAVIALIGALAAPASAQTPLPNIVEQFQKIQHSGAGLAFTLGIGDDPYLWTTFGYCKHYQGLARMDVEGFSYFFLTRSGNHTDSCPGSSDNPGEILVVEMGSRDGDGERLRSNRLAVGTTEPTTRPPVQDIGIAHIHLSDELGAPGWMHPGGVQVVDGVLVIPVSHYCADGFASDPRGVGAYDCLGDTQFGPSGVVFVDVSDPLSPQILKEVNLPNPWGAFGGYGSVAVIREPSGHYLFATMKGPHDYLDFWRSSTSDLRDPGLAMLWQGSWDPHEIVPAGPSCQSLPTPEICQLIGGSDCIWVDPGVCRPNVEGYGWWAWQMTNFLRDADGALYLIAGDGDNSGEPLFVGNDWIRLFRVTERPWTEPPESKFRLEWAGGDRASSERRLETEYPQKGNMKAASGAYVSPTGQLIVYTAHHDRYIQDGTKLLEMGEFRNIDVHVSTTEAGLPPRLEVIDVDGDGRTETSCSGWAELYNDADGWDDNGSPVRGVMLDYRDRHLENWSNLHGDIVFGDATSALRWNLPPGQQLLLYEHAGYGGLVRLPIPEGTGSIGNLGSYWNDRISSVHLTALADAGWAHHGSVGSPIPLTQANPCYGDSDLGDMSFEWAMAASGDACVPASAPPCSLVNPGDVKPQVTCSEPGAYPIRLRVTDTYGAYADVLDDCAYLYVPEPGRGTLLASGISGLLLLELLRRRRERGARVRKAARP